MRLNVTPEALNRLLEKHNMTREEFIAAYGLKPLVYVPELPPSAKVVFLVLYIIIFALALLGNSLVVYIIIRQKAMRTATNIFICSLACSDLLVTFFCIPFTLLQNVSSEWLGGPFVCKMVPFIQTIAVVASTLTMTCIAVERYHGIVHPLKMKRQYTNKRTYKMLGMAVLLKRKKILQPELHHASVTPLISMDVKGGRVSPFVCIPHLALCRLQAIFLKDG
uniref:G-protein coupled receptors family 1 profile domain-containing protein n=1 Tax=Chelonoidis abingdonii TaxID=106734 RepID=A0A8C0QRV2_CHEAB